LLKPEPPEKYNGSASVRDFMKFVTDGTSYVRDGRVAKKYRVSKLARYLTGIAHDFYISKVADDVRNWRLKQFFTALYNHCFPLTYRMDQRAKLDNCRQGERTVRQHITSLSELFNTVGITDERDRVIRLWRSLSSRIQQELWKEKLTPETSLYDEVVNAAELAEMILAIGRRNYEQTNPNNRRNDNSKSYYHPLP
ncbi:hypothetical protein BDZ89DRAFT_955874, partial [Hymenopellis radicata]